MTVPMMLPIAVSSAEESETQQAQAAPAEDHWCEEHGAREHWMRGEGGSGMRGWPGMMHRMIMHRNP